MTKKDYIIIADAINTALWKDKADPAAVAVVTGRLMDALYDDNEKFDRSKFVTAAFADPQVTVTK